MCHCELDIDFDYELLIKQFFPMVSSAQIGSDLIHEPSFIWSGARNYQTMGWSKIQDGNNGIVGSEEPAAVATWRHSFDVRPRPWSLVGGSKATKGPFWGYT
ncbi:unnamed protein product, partial [Nesidiocoris tenuis]